IEKCSRAGVRRVFIGLENIDPDSLMGAKKKQNKITEYRKMLLAWKAAGCITYCGYILGFPNDTAESIRRDIEIIKSELPVDLLEFFHLTPLPGSEDHKKLHQAGVAMDPDLNKYDLNHVTTAHGKMSPAELNRVYAMAWQVYYTPEHIETILRRAAATGISPAKVLLLIVWFTGSIAIEKLHPLEGGVLRRKVGRDRRARLPIEPALLFYPKYLFGILVKQTRWALLYLRLRRIYLAIKHDPKNKEYMDLALSPVADD